MGSTSACSEVEADPLATACQVGLRVYPAAPTGMPTLTLTEQTSDWKFHRKLCHMERGYLGKVEEATMVSPIQSAAESEFRHFFASVGPEVHHALYHAYKISTPSPLTATHTAVLHFAYDSSQETRRRRFVFQSAKLLPRGEVGPYLTTKILCRDLPPQTQLDPTNMATKFACGDAEQLAVDLSVITPLPSSHVSPIGGRKNLSPKWSFMNVGPLHYPKWAPEQVHHPLVDDWERILHLRLSGEEAYKDEETLRDFWMAESGKAREYLTDVATRCSPQAHAKVAASLRPLMVKKGEQ